MSAIGKGVGGYNIQANLDEVDTKTHTRIWRVPYKSQAILTYFVIFLPILRFLYKEKNKMYSSANVLDVIVTTGMQINLYAGIMHFQE